jgi:hypothetical protein
LAELKRAYARLELLYQVSNVIHSTLEPEQALKLICVKQSGSRAPAAGPSLLSIRPMVFWKSRLPKAFPKTWAS